MGVSFQLLLQGRKLLPTQKSSKSGNRKNTACDPEAPGEYGRHPAVFQVPSSYRQVASVIKFSSRSPTVGVTYREHDLSKSRPSCGQGTPQMGPDTETLSICVSTSDRWYTVNNVYIHQGAKHQNLVLKLPSTKCITLEDFNSRHEEWKRETRSPPSDTVMGNRLNILIQASPNIVMANTPRIPTTLSDTTLSLSLVSSDLAAAADWQVLLDCSCQPHFPTLTTNALSPSNETISFSPRFIQEKADWNLFQSLTNQSVTGINFT